MVFQTIEAQLKADTQGFTNGVEAASQSVGGLSDASKKARTAVAGLGVAVAAGAGAALGKSAKAFAGFDASMTESMAIMDDVSQTMEDDMAEAAREVGRTTQHSAEDAADSYFYLASAGLDAQEQLEAMPEVAEFAQAGMFDMAQATDILTDANSALGRETEDMANLGDQLVKANQMANASVEQFGESLKNKAAPAMNRMNVSSEEGVAALAAFADQGLKGRRAGTIMARTLEGLEKQARKEASTFEELGVAVHDSSGEMRPMADIIGDMETAFEGMSTAEKNAALESMGFQKRAQQGIDLMLGNSDAMREYKDELENAGGAMGEVADKQMQTATHQMGLLKDNVHDVAISIGSTLNPAVGGMVKPLVDASQEFSRWAAETENSEKLAKALAATVVGGLGVAIAALAPMLSALVPSVAAVGVAMATVTAPILAGIAALAALAKAWKTDFAGIRSTTMEVAGVLRDEFGPVWDQLKDTVTAVLDAVAPHFESAMATIEDRVAPVVTLIGDELIGAIRFAAPKIVSALAAIENAAQTMSIGGLKEGFKDALVGIPDVAKSAAASFRKHLSMGDIGGQKVAGAGSAFDTLGQKIRGVANAAASKLPSVSTALAGVRSAVQSLLAPVSTVFSQATAKVRKFVTAFKQSEITVSQVATVVVVALSRLLGPLGTVGAAVLKLREHFDMSFRNIRDTVLTTWTQITTVITSKTAAITAALRQTVTIWKSIFVNQLAPIAVLVLQIFEQISTIIGEVLAHVVNTVVLPFFNDLMGLWRTHGASLVQEVVMTYNVILQRLQVVLEAIKIALGVALAAIKAIWTAWGAEIKMIVQTVFTAVRVVVVTALDLILTTVRTVMALIRGDWQMAWTLIQGFTTRTLQRIQLLVTTALNTIIAVVTNAGTIIQNNWRGWLVAVENMSRTAWTFLKTAFQQLGQFIINAVRELGTVVQNNWRGWLVAVENMSITAWNFLQTAFQQLGQFIIDAVRQLATAVQNNWRDWLESVERTSRAAWSFLETRFRQMGQFIIDASRELYDKVTSEFTDMKNDVETAMKNAMDDIKNAISNKASNVKTEAEDVADDITSPIEDLDLEQIGKDAIQDLADGIDKKVSEVGDKAGNVASEIKSKLPGSDADEGPLSNFTDQAAAIPGVLQQEMTAGVSDVHAAAGTLADAANPDPNVSTSGAGNVKSRGLSPAALTAAVRDGISGADVAIEDGEFEVTEDGMLKLIDGRIEFHERKQSTGAFSRNIRRGN